MLEIYGDERDEPDDDGNYFPFVGEIRYGAKLEEHKATCPSNKHGRMPRS